MFSMSLMSGRNLSSEDILERVWFLCASIITCYTLYFVHITIIFIYKKYFI